jgi:serine/threonine protein kinase
VGDVADVLIEREMEYLLKVSRVPEGDTLLDLERKTLGKLLRAAGDTTYRQYLPALVESFPTTGSFPRRVNVFRFQPGWYTLEQVHEQRPALGGRHLAWIFNRLLTILGFIHRQDVLHGAVLPSHVLIHPASHGLQLVGWGQSVVKGQRIRTVPTRFLDWYPPEVLDKEPAGPATDLFLAARCVAFLAGDHPGTNELPASVPLPMQRFFSTCLLEKARMRPDDAWALFEDFQKLLLQLYGPPHFHELTLN